MLKRICICIKINTYLMLEFCLPHFEHIIKHIYKDTKMAEETQQGHGLPL